MKKIPVRRVSACAVLIALEVVLARFASFQVLGLRFGLSFVPMALGAMLLGPWYTAVCYAVADTVGALLFPAGAYFPGFSLTCALIGIVYGLFWRGKDKLRLWPDILAPTLLVTVVLGLGLNSAWMAMLYSSRGYLGWVLFRLPQEAGLFILHLLLLPPLCKLAATLRKEFPL